MDADRFVDSIFGSPTREPGNRWAFTYYRPKPIPRDIPMTAKLIKALSDADAALGTLAGLGAVVTEPSSLIGPYVTREALASSRIEGTQASLSEVLQAEVASDLRQSEDVNEVTAYLAATKLAHQLTASLPISQRMVLEVHRALLSGVRGEERNPGEFRRSPVWVGDVGATPESAVYVPPLPDELPELLADWERFVNEEDSLQPDLVRAALMHYQFETIHPFLDGNGRIGRLLINILLKECGRLPHPLLYLSHYFETNRREYYSALQGVRERGDIETWLMFFLEAVKEQALDAIRRAAALVQVRERLRLEASTLKSSSVSSLVDMLMLNPFVTVRNVESALGMTAQGARNVITKAEGMGWVTKLGTHGRGGRVYWVAQEIFDILERPMNYAKDDSALAKGD